MERVQGQGRAVGRNASLGPAWLRIHRSHWFSRWRLSTVAEEEWALTTGSRSRRAVRESCRTLAMVLPSHYLWLLLPALESQSGVSPLSSQS